MARQLALDLPMRPALERDDYFVSSANRLALAALDDWANWPGGKLVLCGAAGAGKSHLAHVWAREAGARVVPAPELAGKDLAALVSPDTRIALEDLDRLAGDRAGENAAFHLHNLVLARGGRLLMTCASPPAGWHMTLPDLASRIQGTSLVHLPPPDDALLAAVLVKQFADRQIQVSASLVNFLSKRMERSLKGAGELVHALDRESLASRRPITRKLAARVLDKLSRGGA